MTLALKLFGSLVISQGDGDLIRLPTRKSEALLAYLVAQEGSEVSRETVADLLWPLSGPEQARASLRQELSVLRKGLGPTHGERIFSGADRMSFDGSGASIDLWRFRALAAASHDDPEQLKDAVDLHTGPFLDAVRIRSQPFSDWVWATRQTLEGNAIALGAEALSLSENQQNPDQAIEIARGLTRIDPTFEPAHRALMRVFLERGEIDLAKRQMGLCREALKTKLDAEPSEQTQQLAAELDAPQMRASLRPQHISERPEPNRRARQRRTVTFLSVLVDVPSTDPEEFDDLVVKIATLVARMAEAKGGVLFDAFHGRMMAAFGYPTSHGREADTVLGVAFDILDAIEAGFGPSSGCRIGLSQGVVLVSDETDTPGAGPQFVGAAVRDADSLSRTADQGSILVDGSLQGSVSPAFPMEAIAGQSAVQRAVHPHSDRALDGYDALTQTNHAIVGRDTPLAHAMAVLEAAKSGIGGAAAIYGKPGEGKSRLLQDVALAAREQGFQLHVFRGAVNAQQSAFSPLIDQILRAGGGTQREATSIRRVLSAALTKLGPDFAEVAPYFDALHNAPDDAGQARSTVSKDIREKALDIFAAQAGAATRTRPVLFIFEDTQWYDPSSCDAISRLIDALDGTPACVLLTSRDGEAPEVLNHPLIQQVRLAPLDPASAEKLLRGLLPRGRVDPSKIATILTKAEGNPLMIEEFAKAFEQRADLSVVSSDVAISSVMDPANPDTSAPPDRLLPLLLSRIDSIPGAIQVLQHASVLGRRFHLADLSKMLEPIKVQRPLLDALEAAGIVFAARRGADASYIFKHALIGDAIYSTIPMRYRTELHEAAANVLLGSHARIDHAEVARHFRAANTHGTAARHFETSGDKSVRVAANAEAIAEYLEAIRMVAHLPLSHYRMQRELTLNRKVAAQYIALRGIPTAQAAPFYEAAGALSRELADFEETVNAAWGLWSINLMVANLDECLEIAGGLQDQIPPDASETAGLIIYYMLGVTNAYRGSLQDAATQLEAVRTQHSDEMTTDLQSRLGMDIALTSDSFLAWVYALLGDAALADATSQRALARAAQNDTQLNQVFAHVFAATKCLFLDQTDAGQSHAQIALKGAQEMGYRQWIAQAKFQLARVDDLKGEPGALVDMQAAMAEYLSANMVLAKPYALVWIAEAHARRRDYPSALAALDELGAFTERTQERYFDGRAAAARAQALLLDA